MRFEKPFIIRIKKRTSDEEEERTKEEREAREVVVRNGAKRF